MRKSREARRMLNRAELDSAVYKGLLSYFGLESKENLYLIANIISHVVEERLIKKWSTGTLDLEDEL